MKYVLSVLFVFTAQSAFAYSCLDYANRAVAQSQAAAQLGCGFSGPRWSSPWQGHLAYCNLVSPAIAGNEDIGRQQDLYTCLQNPIPAANCNVYAFRAVNQYKASVTLGCGFSGPRWQNNAPLHKAWCSSVPFPLYNSEDQERRTELQACVTK